MSDTNEVNPVKQEEEKTPEVEASSEPPADAAPAEDAEKTEVKEDPPKEMRAIVLVGFGGLKSVRVLKKPEPTLNAGEVLIRVKACGLNFLDLMVRQGAIVSPPKTPFILGFECAGEIEQVGEDVEGLKVGDRVVALPEYRAWAELCAVSARYVYVIPDNMTYLEAAAMAMNYLVAYILVFDMACVSPGKSILLHSAGGGVGQAVAQLCRTIGDVTLFGVCSKSKHEALKEFNNIDHLLDRSSDYGSEVRKASPEGVDIVLDCLCGEECNKGYSLLKPMGKYILYGSSNVVTGETKSIFSAARSWWQVDKISPIKLFDENKTLAGLNLRHLLFQQNGGAYVKRAMDSVLALWKEGKIKPKVDSTWALEDLPEAMQKMHDRKNIGKILLDPSLEPKPKPATPVKSKGKEKVKQTASEEKKDKEEAADEEKKEETVVNGAPGESGDSDSKEKESKESS